MSRSRRSSRVSRLSSKAFNRRSTKSRPLNRAPKPSSHKRWSTRAISKKWRRADSSSSCGEERNSDSPEPRRSRKQKNRNISRKACPGPPLDSGFRRNDGSGGAKAAKEKSVVGCARRTISYPQRSGNQGFWLQEFSPAGKLLKHR